MLSDIGPWVPEKKSVVCFFLFFFWCFGHLGHVIWIIYVHIGSSSILMFHAKIGFDWPSGFRENVGRISFKLTCEPSAQVS